MPEGYTFLGWSLVPLDETSIIDANHMVPNSETLQLYPIWIQTSAVNIINPVIEMQHP